MTMPTAPRRGRTVIADGPAADTLFQRLPAARENERRMRAEQARRDRRAEFVAMIGRRRWRAETLAGAATVAAMMATIALALAEFVR